MEESGAELVPQVRRGDPRAADRLVERYLRAGRAVALAVTGIEADADDVCQAWWARLGRVSGRCSRCQPDMGRLRSDMHRTLAHATALAALSAVWTAAAAQTDDTVPVPAENRPSAGAEVPPPGATAPPSTRYTLTQVDGKPLPFVVENGWRCREEVTAATLTLGGGRWRLETVTRERCGDRIEEERDDDDGSYTRERETIHFLDDDGRANTDRWWSIGTDIELDELRTGIVSHLGTLTAVLGDGQTTLVFRPRR